MQILIKNLKEFLYPLKALKTGIESVVFIVNDDGRLCVNSKSDDGTQISNISWDNSVVEVKDDPEEIGIYELPSFLTTLEMFGGNKIGLKTIKNKMVIKYADNKNVTVNYNMSDPSIITQGPAEPKIKIDWLTEFEVDKEFIKKVNNVASSLDVDVLLFECKDGKLSYQISDKEFHSHKFSEVLLPDCQAEDFKFYMKIERLGIVSDNNPIKISIANKIIKLVLTETKNTYRYYIAPLSIEV